MLYVARTDQCPLYMIVHAALLHRQTPHKGIGAVRRCWHPVEDPRRFVRRDHPDVVHSLRAGERLANRRCEEMSPPVAVLGRRYC